MKLDIKYVKIRIIYSYLKIDKKGEGYVG